MCFALYCITLYVSAFYRLYSYRMQIIIMKSIYLIFTNFSAVMIKFWIPRFFTFLYPTDLDKFQSNANITFKSCFLELYFRECTAAIIFLVPVLRWELEK